MSADDNRKLTGYDVGNPATYDEFSFEQPTVSKKDEEVSRIMAVADSGPIPVSSTRAVWVIHGMGQQMPFETLDMLTNGLTDAACRRSKHEIKPLVRETKIGDQIFQRVELKIPDESGNATEVHLYEAYWAPLTQGKVNLQDVMNFLWNGATRGLLNSFTTFQRAMFGEMVDFKLSWRTPFYTSVALAVIAALALINVIILSSGAARFFASVKLPIPPDRFLPLTTLASIVSVVAITFGVVLFLMVLGRPARVGPYTKTKSYAKLLGVFCWIGFALTVITLIGGALWMGLVISPLHLSYDNFNSRQVQSLANSCALLALALAVVGRAIRRWSHSKGESPEGNSGLIALFYFAFLLHAGSLAATVWLCINPHAFEFFMAWRWLKSSIWVWPFLFLISAVVRKLMVEFVGDVAAYVSPNMLDTFAELRTKIKDTAYISARALYLAQSEDGQSLQYGKIAVVGHSLGSVIAYDTLNRLINEDLLAGTKLRIADRTSLLLTFGSPLDKIAFFFTILSKSARHIREQLASLVQPLIEDYRYRPFPWINIYSRNDIICGYLDFYDKPRTPVPPGVKNIKDEDAVTPLVAHVEYWTNATIWDELLNNLLS